ncbi:MAG TPA: RHS repeat domain-containing protein, partial [Terriglobales bacterium]|nr:RHS repeat domain-containing protein [Terriglobales bacterium]
TSVARFEYDALNRLTVVVTPEGQRLTYSYGAGERSLVARYDHGASLSAAERRDSGLTFASYWEVAATRSLASDFGAVRYSESLGRFQLSGTEGKEVVTAGQGEPPKY